MHEERVPPGSLSSRGGAGKCGGVFAGESRMLRGTLQVFTGVGCRGTDRVRVTEAYKLSGTKLACCFPFGLSLFATITSECIFSARRAGGGFGFATGSLRRFVSRCMTKIRGAERELMQLLSSKSGSNKYDIGFCCCRLLVRMEVCCPNIRRGVTTVFDRGLRL